MADFTIRQRQRTFAGIPWRTDWRALCRTCGSGTRWLRRQNDADQWVFEHAHKEHGDDDA